MNDNISETLRLVNKTVLSVFTGGLLITKKVSFVARVVIEILLQDFMELMNTSPDSGLPIETLR